MIVNLTVHSLPGEPRAFEFRRSEIRVGAGSKNDLIVASRDEVVRMVTLHASGSGVRVSVEASELRVLVQLAGDNERRAPDADLILPVGSRVLIGDELTIYIDGVRRAESLELHAVGTFAPAPAMDAVSGLTPKAQSAIMRMALGLAGAEEPNRFLAEVNNALVSVVSDGDVAVQMVLPLGSDVAWDSSIVFGAGDARLPLETVQFGRGEMHALLDDSQFVECMQGATRLTLVPVTSGTRLRAVLGVHSSLSAAALIERLGGALAAVRPFVVAFATRFGRRAEVAAIEEENRYFKDRQRRHYLFKDLVTESASMRRLHRELGDLVSLDAPVLLAGEAGTGKELLARALHHLGGRSGNMLVSQHCASLDEDALDFELFGYAHRGEDVGSQSQRGVFELANGGTVFLDEIHALSPRLQKKLQRMLAEGEVFRIGESLARAVDVRVVCSTHLNVMELADQGRFRRDLALQLTRHELQVPPLRDRREDIVPLIGFFVKKWARRYRKQVESVDPETTAWLQKLRWPGNVRELLTVIERAVLQAEPDQLTLRRDDFELR